MGILGATAAGFSRACREPDREWAPESAFLSALYRAHGEANHRFGEFSMQERTNRWGSRMARKETWHGERNTGSSGSKQRLFYVRVLDSGERIISCDRARRRRPGKGASRPTCPFVWKTNALPSRRSTVRKMSRVECGACSMEWNQARGRRQWIRISRFQQSSSVIAWWRPSIVGPN